jgi:RsmE family RNA methyltransferase
MRLDMKTIRVLVVLLCLSNGWAVAQQWLAVGPEGGFTAAEVEAAKSRGWQTASLGPRVLRVETAAIAAAAILGERPA